MTIIKLTDPAAALPCVEPVGAALAGIAGFGVANDATA